MSLNYGYAMKVGTVTKDGQAHNKGKIRGFLYAYRARTK